ncbi:MAG: TolC family protein [Gemmatales bacterium]|nr:TolC family protein [Gemmatales bacterium]MDW8385588.1 TolC family protein [Gemmatales bacterium]
MARARLAWLTCLGIAGTGLLLPGCVPDGRYLLPYVPEQRYFDIREAAELPRAPLPSLPSPPTVSDPQPALEVQYLSLDEAIRIMIQNSEVVRILTGVTAVSSGVTIYDPAIANTLIDQEQARFDPNLGLNNRWDRFERPRGEFDFTDPSLARITGERRDEYDMQFGLSQINAFGGAARLDITEHRTLIQPGTFPLNPENRYDLTLNYRQPLLQGGGMAPNIAPIVIARINTERSYWQLKNALQDSVQGVVRAYWALVAARVEAWARQQQVQQGQAAFDRASARLRQGLGNAAEVAQTRLALANFKAALVVAEANVLTREAALKNILGIPPSGTPRIIPTTPPVRDRIPLNWSAIQLLAEERRPDLVELKLIIEADYQRLIQAENAALPQLDMVGLYRWNGLSGTTPTGSHLSTNGGEFTDWTLGLNFSMPIGLRQGRAAARQQQLNLMRDRANLEQALHQVNHELAASARDLAQYYEQYLANREAREAARINLEQQAAEFTAGRAIFLNVFQAIADWGNTVAAEAQALALYNTELAVLEQRTGTILETHGIEFYEDRFLSKGPLCCFGFKRAYPLSLMPTPNVDLYPSGGQEPAENAFELKPPIRLPGSP